MEEIDERLQPGRSKRMGEAIFKEVMAHSIPKLMENMNPSPSFFPT